MSAKRQNRTLLLTPELTSGQRTKDSECGLYDQKRDEINDVASESSERRNQNGTNFLLAREAFNDVIPRFHKVRGTPIAPIIYNYTEAEGRAGEAVELTPDGRCFLIEYSKLIDYVVVSGWVRFTEQFTSAPKLHDKIEGTKVQRGAISLWRNALVEIQNGKCFYDETHDMSSPEVDHLLPWSFVLEDKTWNLVLACRKCNNAKRDRLTDVGALELL